VLIAALLELKSRLILPREQEDEIDLDRAEAADELLARMLEYARYRRAAAFLRERIEAESGFRYRSAPLPKELRRVSVDLAEKSYEPVMLAKAIGGLLRLPEPISLRHVSAPLVSLEQRLSHLRSLLSRRGRFTFDEAVEGADRLTEAITLFALLELYKQGEVAWEQPENFGEITVYAGHRPQGTGHSPQARGHREVP
jgi:segregation and condensation protein A